MTKTKREKNSIIINFWVSLFVVIVLVIVLIFYVIPWLREVSAIKTEAETVYDNYKKLQKDWQSLSDFKKSVASVTDSYEWSYMQTILEDIDKDFYNQYLQNTEYSSFKEFVDNIRDNYSDTSDYDKKIKKISKILPSYSDQISDFWENFLSDFKFINYIESLANTFNINFNNSIGIENVELVDWYSTSAWDSSLETNIYYIPLSLKIDWRKESVLDFLYYMNRVGNIQKDWESDIDFSEEVESDFSELKRKVIIWQQRDFEYNIFNNQISDIEKITFPEYIDSSYDLNNNFPSLVSYIKNTQANESFNVSLDLRFYVKGLPLYKIEEQIWKFLATHEKFIWLVSKMVSDNSQPSDVRQRAQWILTTVTQLNNTVIPKIRASLATKENIDEAYKDSFEYIELFYRYARELWIDLEE